MDGVLRYVLIKFEQEETENCSLQTSELSRYIVFVAGGDRPLISSADYHRAERLALNFAGLTGVRMEVFDSVKEVCYFVEPWEQTIPVSP